MKQKKQSSQAIIQSCLHVLRVGAITVGILCSLAFLATLTYLAWLLPGIPDVGNIQKYRSVQPSIVLTADGTQLTEFRRLQQQYVSLDQISPHIVQALIATEDHRFYTHRGIDFRRTFSAILQTMRGDDQGGSTITQQLARNLFPDEIGRSRTASRKVKEMMTAFKIEQSYTKQEILETYLNTVPFLYNAFGIEMAARTYFDKPAKQLNILESATLVGMLKGTQYYNPIRNPERAWKRRNVVLRQLARHGQLTQADVAALSPEPLDARLYRQNEPINLAPHFTAYVRKWLGDWSEQHGYDMYADGLVVQTTLDLEQQAAAEKAVERQANILQQIADVEWSQNTPRASHSTGFYTQLHKRVAAFNYLWNSRPDLVDAFVRESPAFKKTLASGKTPAAALAKLKADKKFMHNLLSNKSRLEAGLVALDPATGEIKAWVGSRDFATDQFDHVAQAARQPGSTFKPFVYGAALELGIKPGRSYSGGPVEIVLTDGSTWKPTDMDAARGPMTLREGLIYSKNTITAQVMQDVGIDTVVNLAQAMGVRQSRLDPVASIALGTSPVTLLEMVSSYATIASSGAYHAPTAIKRITDRNGKVIAEFGHQPGMQVMSSQSSAELIEMLRGVVSQGTGQKVRHQFGIYADIAGKTGTTQNNTDGWFILMHPNLVAGAWVGFNDQRITMRSSYWGQGGHNAILVVGDFFRDTLKNRRIDIKAQFPRPPRMRHLDIHNPSATPPVQKWVAQPAEDDVADASAPEISPAPGQGIIVRRNGNRTIGGDTSGLDSLEHDEVQSPSNAAGDLPGVLANREHDMSRSAGTSDAGLGAGAE